MSNKFDLEKFRSQTILTQEELTSSWRGDVNRPVVSVLCQTYNHRLYIEDAIRGFLIQRTSFPFEVIIHDDASSDGTSNIINSYALKYPDIIKPIIQDENQYSRGKKPSLLSFSKSSGSYMALCEGDDFWISPSKLQNQFELLEKCQGVDICFHPALMLETDGRYSIINDYGGDVRIIDARFVIRGGGGVMPTAALFVRRHVFENLPAWFEDVPIGDYYLQALAAVNGALYFYEPQSVYRLGSPSSVSARNSRKRGHQISVYYEKEMRSLNLLSEYYGNRLSSDIDFYRAQVAKSCALLYLANNEPQAFRCMIEASWHYCPGLSIEQRVIWKLRKFPKILKLIVISRDKLRKLLRFPGKKVKLEKF